MEQSKPGSYRAPVTASADVDGDGKLDFIGPAAALRKPRFRSAMVTAASSRRSLCDQFERDLFSMLDSRRRGSGPGADRAEQCRSSHQPGHQFFALRRRSVRALWVPRRRHVYCFAQPTEGDPQSCLARMFSTTRAGRARRIAAHSSSVGSCKWEYRGDTDDQCGSSHFARVVSTRREMEPGWIFVDAGCRLHFFGVGLSRKRRSRCC